MTENLGKNIGAVLKEARLKAGLTCEGVARRAGISREYVEQLERRDHLPGTKACASILKTVHLTKVDIAPSLGPVSRARFLTTDIADPASFSNIMRRVRAAKNFTMQDLSVEAAVPSRHLCSIECGEVTPNEKMMQKIAEGLGKQLPEMVA